MTVVFGSTKTYTHNAGLSCCFRQWKAQSHCNMLHGYALQVEVEFECNALDERNWCMDFGGLKPFKTWLEMMFDHTLVAAKDDPMIPSFLDLQAKKVIDLRIVDSVGCEAFSKLCYDWLDHWLSHQPEYQNRVFVKKVVVREHEGNSGYTRRSDVHTQEGIPSS